MAPVPLLVKQWKNQYEIGASTAPFVALISGVSFSYLMTQHGKHIGMLSEKSFYLTAAAGVLIPAIVPFTILVIKPVNDKLAAIVEALDGKQPGEVAVEEQKVEPLLKQWNRLNATRSVMVGLGAVAGLLAIVW
ncbi:60s ribosomal protein l44 [Neofusicoccum parvum]|uniref:DUF1772-domain-containing protein n=2 Tax=Neofusicoccum parvum TaxID=310453 RepID=R1GL14_BOTPV|nr:hypothetical protein UCRNP2_4286 [Neofusicoccum parvum UCRNP2]GME24336.1 60s ribosomal protein l44 [Neofusicoccum parvum]GME40933.1 60s ribosomal protein l44 [Neofusicoccum parvum]